MSGDKDEKDSKKKPDKDPILDILEKISEKADATQGCVNKLSGKLEFHIQKQEFTNKEINGRLDRYNDQLEIHVEGITQGRKLLTHHEDEDRKNFGELGTKIDNIATAQKVEKARGFQKIFEGFLKIVGAGATIGGFIWLIIKIAALI